MSAGSSIKALLKHVQLFLEINIRPNSALIMAANRSFVMDISVEEQSTKSPALLGFIYFIFSPFHALIYLSGLFFRCRLILWSTFVF